MDYAFNSSEFRQHFTLMAICAVNLIMYFTFLYEKLNKMPLRSSVEGMLFVLNERICNGLHSINRADGDDCCSSTDDQTKRSRVVSNLTGIIGICIKRCH